MSLPVPAPSMTSLPIQTFKAAILPPINQFCFELSLVNNSVLFKKPFAARDIIWVAAPNLFTMSGLYGIFKAELNEFLTRELAEDGYSGVEVRVTPTRTEIIILATRTQNVLGEKGRRIRELTAVVQKRFGFPEGSVELYAEKVATRGLCAIAQAESLRYKLLGGLAVRRACYGVLRFIMESGAKGCEVVVSGKLRGQRAKSMKFVDGLMIHSGDPVNYYVDTAVRHVLLRQGVLGIKVKIMLPWDPSGKMGPKKPLPDHVSIVEPKEEVLPTTPISEQKGAKAEVPAMPQGGIQQFQDDVPKNILYKIKFMKEWECNSPVVNLNVGGQMYSTTLNTLRKYPGSKLAEMFSGQPKLRVDTEGRYFIDRDGTHFKDILEFLRSQTLPTSCIQEVYKEAVFFDIEPLIKQLEDSPKLFGEVVGRQQFLARVPNYRENIEVMIRIARAEAVAARQSGVIVCVLRTEEDSSRYNDAINSLDADRESVVRFGPWKAPPTITDLLDCIKMDIEGKGYSVTYQHHGTDKGFRFKTYDFFYKFTFYWCSQNELPLDELFTSGSVEGDGLIEMAAHLKKRVYEEFSKVVQQQQLEDFPAKRLRLTKPSKSAALHIDLCKATNSTDALQYLVQFARKPVEAESVEGVVRILLEFYYKETDSSVRLKIASLLGVLSKTHGFSPDCIVDDVINTLNNEKSHQVLAQLLDTLLVIGVQLPESQTIRVRLVEVACRACKLLTDDYEQVRSAAVQLVWVLSQLYPESIVPIPSSNEEIRLVDDAFGKICHMVNDGSWVVRVQAAKLLGSMQQVSVHFLEQTLDKKLMSDLRRKRTAHERAKELYSSGEFSSGRKWADDAPKEKIDTGAVNLIDSGACGAFVHGLEDEMFEVRIAAVEAVCTLAQASASFAEKCLDFLVDMFNDEIEEVRLQSIHVLRQISSQITLREDQLDTVLAVLEDSSRDIREALHELLCYTNVSTKECIQLALVELLKNLSKYPTDRNSVWKCLKFLGSRHPTLVLPLVPELLSTHPFFDTPEPDMDDPAYIAVLVLVFNAAKSCPTMSALFSDHTFRHYAYLRDSLSHLVPPLRLPGRKLTCVSDLESVASSEESSQQFLQQSLERVYIIQHLEAQGTLELLDFTIRDLKRLGELQPELAGASDFSATYLHCQLLLMKILEETYKLEFLYSGLENRQVAIIHHVRLQAKALQLVLSARTSRGVEPLLNICEKFLQDVDAFQRCFSTELPHFQESFVEKLLELMPRLVTCNPMDLVKILQTTLRQSGFLHLKLPEQIHKATATIIEPTGESDNPLRFTSGLVVALDIDATLDHVQDPQSSVKVQVVYPDGHSHTIRPKPTDFRNPGPGRHRLITQVYLSHSAWTEPCQIDVQLLLAYNSSKCQINSPKSAWSESTEVFQATENCIEGSIPLSKPVKVYIMPKPARR
ncbi:INT4 protein, partial [Polypterus senegalus]